MTTSTFAFNEEQREAIGGILDERMQIPISIEVWARKDGSLVRTDRPPCPHCEDQLRLARMLASLHPGLTVTHYDMDKFPKRAEEEGIDHPPFTVLRGRNGREVRICGFWTGTLFPAVVDVITYLSQDESPYSEASKAALAEVARDVNIHVYGALYDGYSAQMLRMTGALAAESRHFRVQFTEVMEFPEIAARQEIETVPVMLLDDRRFIGVWDEESLVQQLGHIAAGRPDVVTLAQAGTAPYFTEADIERMQAAQAAGQQVEPRRTEGGLYLPG